MAPRPTIRCASRENQRPRADFGEVKKCDGPGLADSKKVPFSRRSGRGVFGFVFVGRTIAQRRPPKDAQVHFGVTVSHPTLVLAERQNELPVQPVLDSPWWARFRRRSLTPHRAGKSARRRLAAENAEPHLVAILPVALRVADDLADRFQSRPAGAVGQVLRHRADVIPPRLFPPVALLVRLMARPRPGVSERKRENFLASRSNPGILNAG